MTIFTDFLAYKEGQYHKTGDSFKFNGQHIVKIVGWEKTADGQEHWIIQNGWGEDWGENGYAQILTQDKSTMLDAYAIGVAIYPMTMGEYYSMQESMSSQSSEGAAGTNTLAGDEGETVNIDEK